MVFVPKEFGELFEEMRDRSTVVSDFEVGSVVRTMYESFAFEIALLYEKMHLVYLSAYVDTAEGQQLDKVVAVLGIARGLPDFAEGTVTFERDVGNKDIEIPLGTLVATEDTPEAPKKVYQTFEPKILPRDHTAVNVKVRAVERGEEYVTPAETIVVMPRPLPGIKSVINREAIIFLGKRRETDDELRERSKNALISAGKATIVSIENALLSLPGVKDVRVRENFHFARGDVTFTRVSGSGDVTIPKGTLLTATVDSVEKPFAATELRVLPDGETTIDVPVESVLEGQAGQLEETGGVAWTIESAGLGDLTAANSSPILLGEFGVVEVFVDGIDFSDPAQMQRLRGEVDRVRAAGIFVLLKAVLPVHVDAVLKIALDPNLSLTTEEIAAFEETVRGAVITFLAALKMGKSLLFSKLIKEILSVEGVDDLEDFRISTEQERESETLTNNFVLSDKRVDTAEFERFNARYICVAAEDKTLTVHLEFKADGLDETALGDVLADLGGHFDGLARGEAVSRNDLAATIGGVAGITLVPDTLTLRPSSWCNRPLLKEVDSDLEVDVTFVEQPVLGDVFAFRSYLEISGALTLSLPTNLTGEEKDSIIGEIEGRIDAYLDALPAEADVVFEDLVALASGVDRVLDVELDAGDFRVELDDGTPLPDRVTDESIAVEIFEKARRAFFCVSGDVETVQISVTAITLDYLGDSNPVDAVRDEVKTAVVNTVNNFLAAAEPGDDLVYSDFKGALGGLVPGANYVVTVLSMQATSLCDNRVQTTDITTGADLHVRSVELPVIQPITDSIITENLPV